MKTVKCQICGFQTSDSRETSAEEMNMNEEKSEYEVAMERLALHYIEKHGEIYDQIIDFAKK